MSTNAPPLYHLYLFFVPLPNLLYNSLAVAQAESTHAIFSSKNCLISSNDLSVSTRLSTLLNSLLVGSQLKALLLLNLTAANHAAADSCNAVPVAPPPDPLLDPNISVFSRADSRIGTVLFLVIYLKTFLPFKAADKFSCGLSSVVSAAALSRSIIFGSVTCIAYLPPVTNCKGVPFCIASNNTAARVIPTPVVSSFLSSAGSSFDIRIVSNTVDELILLLYLDLDW